MLKKAIPFALMSGLILGGCADNGNNNDNGTVPNENETPMENVEDRNQDWEPNVNDDQRGGTNLDGIDNGNGNGNGMNGGVINGGGNNGQNGTMDNANPNNNEDQTIIDDIIPNTGTNR